MCFMQNRHSISWTEFTHLILKYLQAYQNKAPALILVISSASLQLTVLFRIAKQISFKLLAVSKFSN